MNAKVGFRILAAVVLIAAIAGIAFFAFRAGVAQGSPVTIEAPSGSPSSPGSAQGVPAPYPYYGYGYGMPFHRPFGFGYGFGCLGPLLVLFLLFLALRSFRFLFWGPRWGWGHHHYGPWGRQWENGVPPMFEEWHKRAHSGPSAGREQPEERKE